MLKLFGPSGLDARQNRTAIHFLAAAVVVVALAAQGERSVAVADSLVAVADARSVAEVVLRAGGPSC
ncbi:hypothetical protein AAVH_11045 [Aphelenchoides avenae]|nr:hypothetical protein AAVH_11045 [Aphelenchus avenae]